MTIYHSMFAHLTIYTVPIPTSTTDTDIKRYFKYYPSSARDVFTPPFMMILYRNCDYQSCLHIIL